jgi:hypothetical protein
MGLKADPEAAAKAAEAAKAAPVTKAAVEEKAVAALPAAALKEIEEAPKAHAHVETNDDKLFAKAAASGDFSYMEEKWEAFAEKSMSPGEDDEEEGECFFGSALLCIFVPHLCKSYCIIRRGGGGGGGRRRRGGGGRRRVKIQQPMQGGLSCIDNLWQMD